MATHKISVDEFYDTSFSLIALHSGLEDFRIAYLLNKHLNIHLKRLDYDLDFDSNLASYSVFEWESQEQFMKWNLISNWCYNQVDTQFQKGSLFVNTGKTQITNYLIPEYKQVNYLLKISVESEQFNEKPILDILKTIPQIMTSYSLEISQIKTKNNLIF